MSKFTPQGRNRGKSYRHTPSSAFRSIFCRIKWLDNKIDLCAQNGLPFLMYQQERDGLLWFVEKVIEQARKLVKLGDDSQKVTAIINRHELDEYRDGLIYQLSDREVVSPALDNKDRKL